MSHGFARALGALVLVTLTGCEVLDSEPRICTLIGCESGLRVSTSGTSTGPVTLEAWEPGSTHRHRRDCAAAVPCELAIGGFAPAQVVVQITTTAGVRTQQLSPAYSVSRPNGPDCPPECRNGVVSIPATP